MIKTVFDFQVRRILDDLNAACERIAVLESGCPGELGMYVRGARATLLRLAVTDVEVEMLRLSDTESPLRHPAA
jgi:hypothetical protein